MPGLLPLALVAYLWAGWLSNRTGGAHRHVHRLVVGVVAIAGLGTLIGLALAFSAMDAAPDARQATLARGIAVATWSTTLGYVGLVAILVWLGVTTARR